MREDNENTDDNKNIKRASNLNIFLLSLVIVNIVVGIFLFINTIKVSSAINYYKDLDKTFGNTYTIYKTITADFYKELDEKEFLNDINKEIVNSLGEEYTKYYTEEEYEERYGSLKENCILGLGINYEVTEDEKIKVISIDEESQAYKDGLRAKDIISSVNNKTTLEEVKEEISKYEGYELNITVERENEQVEIKTKVTVIKIDSIYSEVIDEKGYIAIKEFSEGVGKEFIDKVEKMQKDRITEIVFDLRNNTGGYVDEAVVISSYIVDKNIIKFTGNENTYEKYGKSNKHIKKETNIELLTNEYSASASEVVIANANEKYVTIGTKTYGKGIAQATKKLKDGYLVYTYSEILANNKTIHKVGIEPDIKIDMKYNDIYTWTWDLNTDKVLQFALQN